jgi:serine/threonine protein phosphatase PrpC
MKMNGITGRKPYVTQYLGIDREEMRIVPAVSRHTVRVGDTFLICSDGLTDMVTEDVIVQILSQDYEDEYKSLVNEGIVTESIFDKNSVITELQVKSLKSKSLQNGGRDNVTIIVCNIIDE